ncbi:MAG: DUF3329 domain-containing protein [Rhizobiaceae bacterium]
MSLLDFNDPFYRPRGVRIAVVVVPAMWSVFEFWSGAPFWGVIFIGAAALAFHGLFLKQGSGGDNGPGTP